MISDLSIATVAAIKLLAIAAFALYVGIVLVRYRVEGPHRPLRLEPQDPARSAWNLLVWLGVEVLGACVAATKIMLNVLLEASAEVGEWAMRLSPAMQKAVRSRFPL